MLVLAASTNLACAQSQFEDDFEDLNKPWQEIAVQIPPTPKQENLLAFDSGPISSMSTFIDAKSVSVGSDQVVRYTLVSKSAGGAQNVSYEGIRCASWEKKLYAFGHKDGQWTRARASQWENITVHTPNKTHANLAKEYFCINNLVDGPAEEIVKRLRSNTSIPDQRGDRRLP